jgi:hypothetical protein
MNSDQGERVKVFLKTLDNNSNPPHYGLALSTYQETREGISDLNSNGKIPQRYNGKGKSL